MQKLREWWSAGKTPEFRDTDRTAVERTWRHKTLLTPAELSFFHVLSRVVQGSCLIVAKTQLADLFGMRREHSAFEKIGQQHIDFLLCDPRTSEMLAAIEVDDHPREHPGRQERDRFMDRLFTWNHLPLIRVPSTFIYAPEKLRRELAKVLGENRLQPLAN